MFGVGLHSRRTIPGRCPRHRGVGRHGAVRGRDALGAVLRLVWTGRGLVTGMVFGVGVVGC